MLLQIQMIGKVFNIGFIFFSAVTFAMRKQLQAEHGKAELWNEIKELEAEKQRLQVRQSPQNESEAAKLSATQ